ncbi:MAG TPA: type II toxin-antitoxin system HicA family toxin [Bryobacteraceae bacterium]
MCRLVETKGWLLRRIKGSHRIYSKPGERKVISIPVHGNKDLKPGLAVRNCARCGNRYPAQLVHGQGQVCTIGLGHN